MSQEASGSSKFSFATGTNAAFIEDLYKQYQANPDSVDDGWKRFFEGYDFAARGDGQAVSSQDVSDNAKMEALINTYRRLGHLSADLSPLDKPVMSKDLDPAEHGLKDIPADQIFHPANLPVKSSSYKEILNLLTDTYCGRIGADFREINDIEQVVWLQEQMEGCRNRPSFGKELRQRVLEKLTQAEGFEQFLQRRYLGQKRFSLEGLESLIPMLDIIASEAGESGAEELCIGMAHRGRLNVLANFMGKPYETMLSEFEGSEFNVFDIDGDVKYHKGFVNEVETFAKKKMRLYLSPNPSHLEVVNPVVEGFVRARQRLESDGKRQKIIPILMHGDAAFIGQGLVAETLNLARLDAYETGGTIHIITNNQIGFTTEPNESRSCVYSSDIVKILRAPVLHVNADDPEAAIWCAQLATRFRQKFGCDIVIDLIGYRRHGHNETDEPAFTQPLMYKVISSHPTVLKRYTDELVSSGAFTADECKKVSKDFKGVMQAAYEHVHGKQNVDLPAQVIPASLQKGMTYKRATRDEVAETVDTGVSQKKLLSLGKKITSYPKDFGINPKLKRIIETRADSLNGDEGIDWGYGELLAFASLAEEGHHVRLSGQDCRRGTFSSRQAVLRDFETGQIYELLNGISEKQGRVDIINSPLSEQGVLGFEFGYSVADREALVLWEAQFGDFANGAQIVIDQFISASEAKWKQASGLVMLLPHGHEGQGPEHSSARPERFLQLCGNLNMQVVIPTTPAQHFHALRRQLHRDFRKPLIVMTPKSLLREKLCRSQLSEFTKGGFLEILDDESIKNPKDVTKLIFCSGKIFYDLMKKRDEHKELASVPVLRLEQLYPFPYDMMKAILKKYPKLTEIIWTQEEPQNMGGWNFARGRFLEVMSDKQKFKYVGRKNSGTPAEGSGKAHEVEQERIINDALGLACGWTPKAVGTGK